MQFLPLTSTEIHKNKRQFHANPHVTSKRKGFKARYFDLL